MVFEPASVCPHFVVMLSETAWPTKAKFYMKASIGRGNQCIYEKSKSHDQDGGHAYIFKKKCIFFKNLLLNRWTDFNETWHEASMTQVVQCIYKS